MLAAKQLNEVNQGRYDQRPTNKHAYGHYQGRCVSRNSIYSADFMSTWLLRSPDPCGIIDRDQIRDFSLHMSSHRIGDPVRCTPQQLDLAQNQ